MTNPTDDATRADLKAEARAYIAARLHMATALFKAELLAILARHGRPAHEAA
jgi:hypothetical protein